MEKRLRVSIDGSGSALQGVGRLPDGRAVFVEGALPGETVEIAVTKEAGRYAFARLCSVIEPSPERAAPFCPHYGDCGGCAAQHMTYAETLCQKTRAVADALRRIGGLEGVDVRPCLGMEVPTAYRNKVEYAVDRSGRLGFARAASHDVVPALDCPLAEPGIPEAARAVQEWIGGRSLGLRWVVLRRTAAGEIMCVLSYEHSAPARADGLRERLPTAVKSVHACRLRPRPAHALDGRTGLICGAPALTETLAGMRFSLSPQAFFQVNRSQCERMIELACRSLRDGEAGLTADVYCGVGTFSLALARESADRRVLGFEIVPQAVANARDNALANGLSDRVSFFAGDAALTLPRELRGRRLAAALVDPPRKGVAPEALQALLDARPQRLVYVSCDPATLARDLRVLSITYFPAFAQPVDMFPWTAHVECVVLMSKAGPLSRFSAK